MSPWERIQQHKIAQWTLAYAAAAYTLLHTTEMVSDALEWPHLVVRALTLTLLLALPVVVVLAWYHGHKAQHRISTGELSILTVLLVMGAGLLWAFTRTPGAQPSEPSSAAMTASSPAAGAPSAAATKGLVAASVVSAAAPAASVAVVPFANLTGDPGKEYFSDGMAEELINELTMVPGLKVPARTSSFAYKGRDIDSRQIARDLGVAAVLEGSVRAAGDRIRVTAQLVNAQNGYDLWSKSYDRNFGDVFKLQDDIAAQIVEALKTSLHAQLAPAVAVGPPTEDPEAYRLYMQARSLSDRAVTQIEDPLRLLDEATARDPRFARAFAAKALIRAAAVSLGSEIPGALADARRDADEALGLDSSLSDAHVALAVLNAWQGRWVAAESEFHHVIELYPDDPSLPGRHSTFVLSSTGQMRRALGESLRAYQLAPATPGMATRVAATASLMGLDDDALKYARLETAPNATDLVALTLTNVARHRRQYDRIIATMRAQSGPLSGMSVVIYEALKDPARRPAALEALKARAARPSLGVQAVQGLTLYFVLLDDLDSAYALVNRALDDFARSGSVGTTWGILWATEMRPFRRDPRFGALVARLKLPEYWKQYGPPDECTFADGKLVCR